MVTSTILRAIKSGRLSATKTAVGGGRIGVWRWSGRPSAAKTAAGGYEIDGAELSRVFPSKPTTVAPETAALIAAMEAEAKALTRL